jgi:hypothetical protein
MPRQTDATTPRSRPLAVFTAAIIAYIGYNVIATLAGIIARLPDVTTTHATTDQVPLGQVIFPDGTIISPPLIFMVLAALLLWGVISNRKALGAACASLLILGAALTSIAEVTGLGNRPSLFSPAKWHVAVVAGTIYGVIGLAVVITGVAFLYHALAERRRLTSPDRA